MSKWLSRATFVAAAGYPGTTAMAQRGTLWDALMTRLGLTATDRSTVTADATLSLEQCGPLLVDATSGNVTLTLPPSGDPTDEAVYEVDRLDASANTLTITAGAGDSIDGESSIVLTGSITLRLPAGSNVWRVHSISGATPDKARRAIGAAKSGADDTITSVSAIASVNTGPLAGLRNAVINGNGLVQQRAAPTLTAALQYGVADRHLIGVTSGTSVSGTVGVLANAGFSCGVGYGAIAASWTAGQFIHKHRIEAANTKRFNGKTVTVSGNLYQDTGGSRSFTVSIGKPTTTADTFSAITNLGTSGVIAVPSGTVTAFSYTLALGSTDASLGLESLITDNAANTVVSKNYLVGDLQLEIGSVGTLFEQRPIALEKAMCERYFRKSYNHADAPGTVTSVGAVTSFAQVAPLANGFYIHIGWTPMRATPTIVAYSPTSGASGVLSNAGTDRTATLIGAGESGIAIAVGVSSNASAHSVHYTASAEL